MALRGHSVAAPRKHSEGALMTQCCYNSICNVTDFMSITADCRNWLPVAARACTTCERVDNVESTAF